VLPLTVQINLSPGDIGYAELTVPRLVAAHRGQAVEALAVVDCVRPQRTRTVDPDRQFPEPEYTARVQAICGVAETLRARGCFDRVEYLRPGDPVLARTARRYLRWFVRGNKDHRAVALIAYAAGLELARTQYVVHYDADMLLYQAPGYAWAAEAIARLQRHPAAVMATPRVSPPFLRIPGEPDGPSRHRGDDPALRVEGGWRLQWFSTRCFLVDRARLEPYLPLVQGRLLAEVVLRMVLGRSYPPALETLLHRRISPAGGWRLDLDSEQAWLLHPAEKSARFLALLPALLDAVGAGHVPDEQRGWENLNLDAWEHLLLVSRGAAPDSTALERIDAPPGTPSPGSRR
jgi:hypothetical protein